MGGIGAAGQGAYRTAPTPPRVLEHGLALALRGRCPFCAEVTGSPGILSGAPCDVCGGAYPEDGFGARVRGGLAAMSMERFWLVLGLTTGVSVLAAPLSLLALLPQLGALIAFRVWVVGPCLALLAGRRRRVARWTLRLMTTWILTLGSLALFFPCAAPIETALMVSAVWLAGRRYLMWQLAREEAREPIAGVEWLLLLLAAGLVFLVLAIAIGVASTLFAAWQGFLSCVGLE